MRNNYLVLNPSTDPYYNLALEEFLLKNYLEGVVVMLWQNDRTIVVGRHQNTLEEINYGYVKEKKIRVVRRTTGGGAVYHDMGNLNYSIITDRCDKEEGIRKYVEPIIQVMGKIDVHAVFSGRNDIMVGDKKVSGTAQRIYGHRILNHGCLLYESDLEEIGKSLNVRKEKFQSKAIKSVRSRVGNVRDFLSTPLSLEEFKEMLKERLLEDGYEVLSFSQEEKREIEKLQKDKYEAWEWTYGNPIKCMIHNYKHYQGGTVEAYVNVAQGRISECRFYGDFMALRPVSEVEASLIGCRYWQEDLEAVLSGIPLKDYFGEINIKEIIEVILGFCAPCSDVE